MLWFKRKDYLIKNDVISLYKTVRFFKNEFLKINIIKDNILNYDIYVFYNTNIYETKNTIVCLTDFDCDDKIIKWNLINGTKNVSLIDFITDENGYISDNINNEFIELLDYIIILLEFYTNTLKDKKVNSHLIHRYIIKMVDVYKLIYKEIQNVK